MRGKQGAELSGRSLTDLRERHAGNSGLWIWG